MDEVRGFVTATADFENLPKVLNGASDLIVEILGPEVGSHARTSIGCPTLPIRVAVELDALIVIDEERLEYRARQINERIEGT